MKKILFVASVMLFIKLCLSANVYGTNDITYWMEFSKVIEKFGTSKIYSMVSIYNHPPLMSWILKFIAWLQDKTQVGFPYLFRLMPIIADFLSVLVIWELLKRYDVKNKVLICVVCALNPINFFVSGFHGNTDPLFILFVLVAIYLLERDKTALAGIFYGLSLCIKVVPLILLPVFFYFLKTNKQRAIFFISSLMLPVLVFLPYLILDYHSVIKNIFFYGGLNGIWGIGHLLVFFKQGSSDIFRWHILYFKLIFFAIEIVLIKYFTRHKKLNLTELCFLSFALFLTLTPGFGVQYLSWLSFFAVMVFPGWGSVYVLLSGIFLYKVYVFWGGGTTPYYANSIIVGQWGGFEAVLDIVLWLIIAVMLFKFILGRLCLTKSV